MPILTGWILVRDIFLKIMKKLLLVIPFALFSCKKEAKEITQNGKFKLDFLFEQNGCRMYRFEDGGRWIYWSDCKGKIQSDYSTNSGKTSTIHYEETITTN